MLSAISKRTDLLSNDHDPDGERNGYQGISIPSAGTTRGGFIEMDPPEQSEYRRILNPFLSPAAVEGVGSVRRRLHRAPASTT